MTNWFEEFKSWMRTRLEREFNRENLHDQLYEKAFKAGWESCEIIYGHLDPDERSS